MNSGQLIVTFANQAGSPEHTVLRLSPDGRTAHWLPLRSITQQIGTINGVCGACVWDDRLAFCTQTMPAYLAIVDTRSWELVLLYLMEGVADPHGLLKDGDRLLVASTGINEVFELGLAGDEVAYCKPVWSFPGVGTDADHVHLNGLSIGPDGVIASAFGPRDETGGWKAGQGVVQNITSGEVVATGLFHPHTPVVYGDSVYVCESLAGACHVYRQDEEGRWSRTGSAAVGGYPRGLNIVGDTIFVGISGRRSLSRSRQRRNEDVDDFTGARIVSLSADLMTSKAVELSAFGREIYEIVYLPVPIEGGGLTGAIAGRAVALQLYAESLIDVIGRLSELSQPKRKLSSLSKPDTAESGPPAPKCGYMKSAAQRVAAFLRLDRNDKKSIDKG